MQSGRAPAAELYHDNQSRGRPGVIAVSERGLYFSDSEAEHLPQCANGGIHSNGVRDAEHYLGASGCLDIFRLGYTQRRSNGSERYLL